MSVVKSYQVEILGYKAEIVTGIEPNDLAAVCFECLSTAISRS